jgi:hypothetical protein
MSDSVSLIDVHLQKNMSGSLYQGVVVFDDGERLCSSKSRGLAFSPHRVGNLEGKKCKNFQ